jgi:hypothetical protein
MLTTALSSVSTAHRVATVQSSTNGIVNATISYYCAASSLHTSIQVRETICWWLALSFGKSYNCDVLQYAKQLFSFRLPQMMRYCIMRECDNINTWICLSCDLVFSQQDRIYGFTFPKRFLEISSRELTSLLPFY